MNLYQRSTSVKHRAQRLPLLVLSVLVAIMIWSHCSYTPDFYKHTDAPISAFSDAGQVRAGGKYSSGGFANGYIAYSPLKPLALAYNYTYKNTVTSDSIFRRQDSWEMMLGTYYGWDWNKNSKNKSMLLAELYAGYGYTHSSAGEEGYETYYNQPSQTILHYYRGGFDKLFLQLNVTALHSVNSDVRVCAEAGGYLRCERFSFHDFYHEKNHSTSSLSSPFRLNSTMLSMGVMGRVGTEWLQFQLSGSVLIPMQSVSYEFMPIYLGAGVHLRFDLPSL